MPPYNSLVMTTNVIASLLIDISTNHTQWFPIQNARLTVAKLRKRVSSEGIGFLTKTLPHLGKSFDQALAGTHKLDCGRFQKLPSAELPRFLGEFFLRVFTSDGWIKPDPCVVSIRTIRQVLYLFYKYQLPYEQHLEEKVISEFKLTEDSLPEVLGTKEGTISNDRSPSRRDDGSDRSGNIPTINWCSSLIRIAKCRGESRCTSGKYRLQRLGPILGWRISPIGTNLLQRYGLRCGCLQLRAVQSNDRQQSVNHYVQTGQSDRRIVEIARNLITRVLCNFDPRQITPRHGRGSVATGEKTYEKMRFKRFYTALNQYYSYDEYFYSSLTHLCDEMSGFFLLEERAYGEAKVILVPKDSRGPRLISCEPLEYMWIQQGLGRALSRHIEAHPLTRGLVNFTDQTVNRKLALSASIDGSYATIDLKEASDRVSLRLVRELYPEHVLHALEATRSVCTRLPDGSVINLRKFAPMGSSLCFPVLALTVWALTTASILRKQHISNPKKVRGDVYVYGDDVIVRTAHAADAITGLESADLKINSNKSFLTGFFRESCGLDAYKGVEVQPVRIKTVWESNRCAGAYSSWMSYANSFMTLGYKSTALLIARELTSIYGPLPTYKLVSPWYVNNPLKEGSLGYPYLGFDAYTESDKTVPRKWNAALQRYVYKVFYVKPKKVKLQRFSGWSELLRYLSSSSEEFRAGEYTVPRASMLARGWR